MILAAAERRLIAEGPDAVRVQLVARDVGLTDAAVHHHFGDRQGLLTALLRHAARRLQRELTAAMARWEPRAVDVRALVRVIARTYETRGYSRLTAWMVLAGWQPTGSGMFRPLVDTLHRARVRAARRRRGAPPPLDDTRLLVALVNVVLWAETLGGGPMRRSVDLGADRATALRFREWFAGVLARELARAR